MIFDGKGPDTHQSRALMVRGSSDEVEETIAGF